MHHTMIVFVLCFSMKRKSPHSYGGFTLCFVSIALLFYNLHCCISCLFFSLPFFFLFDFFFLDISYKMWVVALWHHPNSSSPLPINIIIPTHRLHCFQYSSFLFIITLNPNHCCSCSSHSYSSICPSYLSSLLLILMFVFLFVIVLLCLHTHHMPIHPLIVHCSYLSSLSSCHILLLKLPF